VVVFSETEKRPKGDQELQFVMQQSKKDAEEKKQREAKEKEDADMAKIIELSKKEDEDRKAKELGEPVEEEKIPPTTEDPQDKKFRKIEEQEKPIKTDQSEGKFEEEDQQLNKIQELYEGLGIVTPKSKKSPHSPKSDKSKSSKSSKSKKDSSHSKSSKKSKEKSRILTDDEDIRVFKEDPFAADFATISSQRGIEKDIRHEEPAHFISDKKKAFKEDTPEKPKSIKSSERYSIQEEEKSRPPRHVIRPEYDKHQLSKSEDDDDYLSSEPGAIDLQYKMSAKQRENIAIGSPQKNYD
jgi:hypothetical protein